jgi:hypothetical protein
MIECINVDEDIRSPANPWVRLSSSISIGVKAEGAALKKFSMKYNETKDAKMRRGYLRFIKENLPFKFSSSLKFSKC